MASTTNDIEKYLRGEHGLMVENMLDTQIGFGWGK